MRYIILVLLGAASYGLLSTIVVFAYKQGFVLGEVVGMQLLVGFLITGCVLFVMRLYKKGRGAARSNQMMVKPTWKQRVILMVSGLPMVITSFSYYGSLQYVPASLAIVLLFQFTWITTLIQMIHHRQRPHKIILLTLGILLVGTVLAAGVFEQTLEEFHWLGIGFGLLSALSYSFFIYFNGKVVTSIFPLYRTFWMLAGAMVVAFCVYPPQYLFNGKLGDGLMYFGCLLGLLGAFIPPALFAVGVPHIGEGMAGILGAIELPVAMFASVLILQEYVSGLQLLGVILILLGVVFPEGYRWLALYRMKRRSHPRSV